MECCFTDFKKCDDGFCVSPAFPAIAPDCCEAAGCCDEKPVIYCCTKKPKNVIYCCKDMSKKSSGEGHCEKKPEKVLYCCEKKPPKVVYCYEKKPPKVVYCCEKPPEPSLPKPAKTKYIMPCYRYEDGRIVQKLPVTAFKRNGMQDQEHSKLLGTVNFLVRCPRDVSIECNDLCNLKVGDPAKVSCYVKKKPIKNQPTVLMRRACEVAYGRRKPFVASSYHVDAETEERRYHSEDDKSNLCFHYDRKKPQPENCCTRTVCCDPTYVPSQGPSVCCPQKPYVTCLPANPCSAPTCCYYYI